MLREAFDYVSDVAGFARTFLARAALRRPGAGVDYREDRFRAEAWRIVSYIHPKRMRLLVVDVVDETPTTKTFRLERVDGDLPPFRAGQYLNVYACIDGVRTSRPYCVSSAPGRDTIDLTVKTAAGGFVSPHLFERLTVGDEVDTSGPAGSFFHEPLIHGRDLVMIAGGSGVTPFLSMIRALADLDDPPRVHLVYGSRDDEDVIFNDVLVALERSHAWLDLTIVISAPSDGWPGRRGLIDAELLGERVGPVEGKMFFVCGPAALYPFVSAALEELGVPGHRVLREPFGPPQDVTTEVGWPASVAGDSTFAVEVEGKGVVRARAGEPLLVSLERANLGVESLCRSGHCSACRVKVVGGDVFVPPDAGIRESDRRHGFTHACVAYPLTDLQVRT
jgi:ferredoxin-NADP reductase